MTGSAPSLTYVGGPTAVLDWGGVRILTDPTFDAAPTAYELPGYTLRKTQGPAIGADASAPSTSSCSAMSTTSTTSIGPGARCSRAPARAHDGRRSGRARPRHGRPPGVGEHRIAAAGATLHVTATPARHGPADGDRGPVIGFAVAFEQAPDEVVYVSGDTVWYEGVREVAERFSVRALLTWRGTRERRRAAAAHAVAEEGVEVARRCPPR